MAEKLIAVRMKRTIDQQPIVVELLMGEVYSLPELYAEQLMSSDACERVLEAPETSPRLEAAALAPARRRG